MRKRLTKRPTRHSNLPVVQAIESRQHLSVTVHGHTLVVITGDGKDVVVAKMTGKSSFDLTVNGDTARFSTSTINRLDITTKDAADLIDLRGMKIEASVNSGKGGDTIYGTRRADSLFGNGGADMIFGEQDNDTIIGGLRNDSLDGGDGNDTLVPFSDTGGDDTVTGGAGTDTVDYTGALGNITLEIRDDGHEPSLVISDQIAPDVEIINTGPGNDVINNMLSTGLRINGGAGSDSITGGSGNDTLSGGPGADLLQGNDGNDVFRLGGNDGLVDTIQGGTGTDTIVDSAHDSHDVITGVP